MALIEEEENSLRVHHNKFYTLHLRACTNFLEMSMYSCIQYHSIQITNPPTFGNLVKKFVFQELVPHTPNGVINVVVENSKGTLPCQVLAHHSQGVNVQNINRGGA